MLNNLPPNHTLDNTWCEDRLSIVTWIAHQLFPLRHLQASAIRLDKPGESPQPIQIHSREDRIWPCRCHWPQTPLAPLLQPTQHILSRRLAATSSTASGVTVNSSHTCPRSALYWQHHSRSMEKAVLCCFPCRCMGTGGQLWQWRGGSRREGDGLPTRRVTAIVTLTRRCWPPRLTTRIIGVSFEHGKCGIANF